MKTLRNVVASNIKDIITEKLVLNKSTSKENEYKYHPKDWDELRGLLKKLLDERGEDADLNDIDVSNVNTFRQLFIGLAPHNIDLSEWDTSNVTNMNGMFEDCTNFKSANIANWDTSKVEDMRWVFTGSKFNEEIAGWDVSNVENMRSMFYGCKKFNSDLSQWNVRKVKNMYGMFDGCESLKKKPSWYVQ